MGTRFELVLPGDDETFLRAAGEEALAAIEEVHRTFTRFESSGLPAHLRRVAPRPVRLSTDDATIFEAAERIGAASGGAFDLRCGGEGRIVLTSRAVALSSTETELDFGAIAKGFGIDRAVAVLREAGVLSAFLHGGTSSCYGLGAPPGSAGWRVRLGDGADDPIVVLRDEGLGVSASWIERDGSEVAHLRLGNGGPVVTARRRAAVIGPSAGWADGWATALTLTGDPQLPGAGWTAWLQEESRGWRSCGDLA